MPRRRFSLSAVVCAVLVLCTFDTAMSQSTQPAVGKYEDRAIGAATAKPANSAATRPSSGVPIPTIDFTRLAWSLGIVLALIIVLRVVARRLFPGATVPGAGSSMRVLSRMVVGPRQQLLMIQIGRRVVVAADSGGQMSCLTEITDPDEIAHLVGQLQTGKLLTGPRSFPSLFGKASEAFEPPPEVPAATLPSEDPSVSATRGEIQDLMSKVRTLSAQFMKS